MKRVYHLTKQGKMDLEKELKELIDSRTDVADEIATARGNGDLSENAEYASAREKQGRIESRILEIENILNSSQIIESGGDGVVGLGDKVVVSIDGEESTFSVVGAIEADPTDNKISHESPLGNALIGKKVGDEVSIETPKGTKIYKVVKVN